MDKEVLTESELVKRCIDGERKYQEMLYRKYAAKMFGVCLGYAKDKDDAKDVLQEGFIKVFASLKNYKGEGSLGGWIRRTIVNKAIDCYRGKLKDLRNVDVEDAGDIQIDISVLDKIQEKELLNLIAKLPEGSRIVFNLFVVEGYKHIEIAEMLNISQGTSKSQYSRARSLLQKWIGESFNYKTVSENY